jgi:hypothetical protein
MEEPICPRNVASPFGDGDPIRNFILFILFILSQLLLGLLSNCVVPAKLERFSISVEWPVSIYGPMFVY